MARCGIGWDANCCSLGHRRKEKGTQTGRCWKATNSYYLSKCSCPHVQNEHPPRMHKSTTSSVAAVVLARCTECCPSAMLNGRVHHQAKVSHGHDQAERRFDKKSLFHQFSGVAPPFPRNISLHTPYPLPVRVQG